MQYPKKKNNLIKIYNSQINFTKKNINHTKRQTKKNVHAIQYENHLPQCDIRGET